MKIYLLKLLLAIILLNTAIIADNINLKFTLLNKIPEFITWPYLDKNFVIAVYKDEKLKEKMVEYYKDKNIHKLTIKVININNSQDERLKDVNLFYNNKDNVKSIEKFIKELKKYPILIVTEFPDYVYDGLHISFYFEHKRIKFLINTDALDNSKLKASYKLLKLSKIVKEED